jgi:hypothetical protein
MGRGNYRAGSNNNSNRQGSNNNSNNNSNNGGGKPKKSTGCKAGVGAKSNAPWVSGWNLQQRRGMLSFLAFPYEGTSEHTSEQGRQWQNWVAKIKINGVPQNGVMPCLFEPSTGKVHFKEMGMIANPKKDYFGTMFKD